MDPKKMPDLDPKLKEAYERVMGTAVNGAKPVAVTPPAPTPTPPPPPPAAQQTTPPETNTAPQPVSSPAPEVNPLPEPENKKQFSPVILVVVGIVFFLVYILFWLKFFSIPLPFLPQ